MSADPIVYCLEHLTDYTQFERLCHDLMVLEGYRTLEPLGGCHDKGRDAIHVNRFENVVTIFCYSVRGDWFEKLKQDAKVIHQHGHQCDRLAYLSTYNFTSAERDDAVKFIKESHGWELEPFGLERLRVLLSKHNSLISNHPQIFHPSFFDGQGETPECRLIRSLMSRLAAANEKYMSSHLRLVGWPHQEQISMQNLINKDRSVTVAIGDPEMQEPHTVGPDVVLPNAAVRHCSKYAFWGSAGISREHGNSRRESRLLFLVWGGPQSDAAAEEFGLLAAESGRVYQTLPPSIAPIKGTTSPRNLWATALFGWLRGTAWVLNEDRFAFIGLPFGASVELWRRLLHGTTPDGRIESPRTLSEGAQRILLAATAAKRQTVTMNSDMHGFHLGTGDEPLIETSDARQIAECRSWVQELLNEKLIEDRWHKGQVFAVTGPGYAVADEIRGPV